MFFLDASAQVVLMETSPSFFPSQRYRRQPGRYLQTVSISRLLYISLLTEVISLASVFLSVFTKKKKKSPSPSYAAAALSYPTDKISKASASLVSIGKAVFAACF